MPAAQKPACANPDALGVGRVVEIDTTGGPGFGFEHFKQLDFLEPKEVVLTFDDGPWPGNTPAVLKALADECTKGLFFPIGKHATYHPEILRQVAGGRPHRGHAHLVARQSERQEDDRADGQGRDREGHQRGEMGARRPRPAPFFRFPELQHNPAAMAYLGSRNVAMFSTDLNSFDFRKSSSPDKVVTTVMTKLDKLGKGIILMHDFQKHTADALPTLLRRLKEGGYKVVQIKAKTELADIARI